MAPRMWRGVASVAVSMLALLVLAGPASAQTIHINTKIPFQASGLDNPCTTNKVESITISGTVHLVLAVNRTSGGFHITGYADIKGTGRDQNGLRYLVDGRAQVNVNTASLPATINLRVLVISQGGTPNFQLVIRVRINPDGSVSIVNVRSRCPG